jgi:hypothetical protein
MACLAVSPLLYWELVYQARDEQIAPPWWSFVRKTMPIWPPWSVFRHHAPLAALT